VVVGTYSAETGYASGHAPGVYVCSLDPASGALTVEATIEEHVGPNPAYAAYARESGTLYLVRGRTLSPRVVQLCVHMQRCAQAVFVFATRVVRVGLRSHLTREYRPH
jgi:hypothetical protein